jgi:hypothetical protein
MTSPPLPQLPDHWHLTFESVDLIIDNGVTAGVAFLDFCENIFADSNLDDRAVLEEKIAYYAVTSPFTALHMSYGHYSALCVPCKGCKRRSLN